MLDKQEETELGKWMEEQGLDIFWHAEDGSWSCGNKDFKERFKTLGDLKIGMNLKRKSNV